MAALMPELNSLKNILAFHDLFTFLGPGRYIKMNKKIHISCRLLYSVVDQYVFGPDGSGSESGSGSFGQK